MVEPPLKATRNEHDECLKGVSIPEGLGDELLDAHGAHLLLNAGVGDVDVVDGWGGGHCMLVELGKSWTADTTAEEG